MSMKLFLYSLHTYVLLSHFNAMLEQCRWRRLWDVDLRKKFSHRNRWWRSQFMNFNWHENFRKYAMSGSELCCATWSKSKAHRVGSATMIDDHPSIIAQLKFKLMALTAERNEMKFSLLSHLLRRFKVVKIGFCDWNPIEVRKTYEGWRTLFWVKCN